ncbi:sulfite oxidase-like oxidoreductase [Streptomyces sp. T1317-0309]|nr:sulfite oxidase-like oxidoreductase [Streptomyces sp. T1317-0309]
MNSLSPGFRGRRRSLAERLPPGQYPTESFPVLSAGPTPRVSTEDWAFTVTTERGDTRTWTWEQMTALPQQGIVQDIHCVTRWSKFDTRWRGVPPTPSSRTWRGRRLRRGQQLRRLHQQHAAGDLLDGRAWIVHSYEGYPLSPEHGGPARLLVPHLYLWKSAKWVRGLRLAIEDEPGFWESIGYHGYGDPWREQRTWGD